MPGYKISTWAGMLTLFLFLLPFGILIYFQWLNLVKEFNPPGYELTLEKTAKISADEKIEIDVWIRDNNLNQYGDPKGTVYTGGTPLFDETTGKRIDRYEYILKKHPDRPWQK